MAEKLAAAVAPVTFRPSSAESRDLLEAVAAFSNLSVSKLVARAIDDYVAAFVKRVGADEIAKQRRADAEERERSLTRQMAALLRQGALAPDSAIMEDPSFRQP
jgi:hypothetical protein